MKPIFGIIRENYKRINYSKNLSYEERESFYKALGQPSVLIMMFFVALRITFVLTVYAVIGYVLYRLARWIF